jgi:hypothetical protein
MTPPAAPRFAALCDLAERHGLVVEIMTDPEGKTAIWVFPPEAQEFEVGEKTATMRVGIVATPFWDYSFDDAAPQLIKMLNERGYR